MDKEKFEEEFLEEFKRKILNNKDVMKRINKRMMPYLKMPTGSEVVKKSMAAEFAKIFREEMEKD